MFELLPTAAVDKIVDLNQLKEMKQMRLLSSW